MQATRFSTGQWLKHSIRPEWGIGEVLAVSDNMLLIRFSRAGLKRLLPGRASQSLEPVEVLPRQAN